jgi:hypothetical protein
MKTRLELLLPLIALLACTAENNASIKVFGICAVPDDPSNCSFAATCDAQSIGPNVLDVGQPIDQGSNRLWVFVQVNNQLPENTNLNTFRTNTNDAYVHEAVVEYPGTGLPTTTSPILGSAVVPADGTAVISVTPIPESVGAILQTPGAVPAGSIIDGFAKLKLKGVLGDTTKFETGSFDIPIRACNGCIGALVCNDPNKPIRAVCPPNDGQLPASAACLSPQ